MDKEHPITKGVADWTTTKEELYNNITVYEASHPLAKRIGPWPAVLAAAGTSAAASWVLSDRRP